MGKSEKREGKQVTGVFLYSEFGDTQRTASVLFSFYFHINFSSLNSGALNTGSSTISGRHEQIGPSIKVGIICGLSRVTKTLI